MNARDEGHREVCSIQDMVYAVIFVWRLVHELSDGKDGWLGCSDCLVVVYQVMASIADVVYLFS
jgi:hypothetical protein